MRGQHRGTVTYPPRRNAPTIYILTRLWLRGSGVSSRGDSFPGPPRVRLSGAQQRVDDAITLTGHRESAGRDAIVRNDERRRERTPRPFLTAISLSRFSFNFLIVFILNVRSEDRIKKYSTGIIYYNKI